MTGLTSPDRLPYPDDYNQPADVPAAVKSLADATQAALVNKVDRARQIVAGAGLSGGGALDADRTLNIGSGNGIAVHADHISLDKVFTDTLYAPIYGSPYYSASDHLHAVASLGIIAGTWDIGTLAPGQEVENAAQKPYGYAVFLTVQHRSTYIFAVCDTTSPTTATMRVRNSTTATTHTNVKLYWMFVPPAA